MWWSFFVLRGKIRGCWGSTQKFGPRAESSSPHDEIVDETRKERRGASYGSWGDREEEERLESMQVGDAHHQ
jgi:hypothetical protein